MIGSGTVGTGCLLELGGDELGWLKVGDVVELEVERLGLLRNRIVDRPDSDHAHHALMQRQRGQLDRGEEKS